MSRLLATCWLLLICSATSLAAEKTVRLRLAWGSGTAAKERWIGTISVEGGALSDLQPLGIETDAPVALRIERNRLIVNPLLKRGFDGCDVTVRAEESALVRVELRTDESAETTVIESSLSELIVQQVQEPLDVLGSYFLARRSPGDALRILPTREHLVFSPAEKWDLRLQPDLEAALASGPVTLEVMLRAAGEDKPQWQSSQQLTHVSQLTDAVRFEITSPPREGAYRLTITAKRGENLAARFVPGQRSKSIAQRDVEFVVIDPTEKLPPLLDQWLPVLTIDPANPKWWQRLPAWAQVPRLRERTQGSIGNVRPVVRPMPAGELLELPPAPEEGDPYWQSYTLPVRDPGEPHLVEVEYPLGVEQSLDIVLVEPDAAGKVTSTDQFGSFRSDGKTPAADGETAIHRFIVWPKTPSPQLLIVNRDQNAPAQYGKIRLLRQDSALASLLDNPEADADERLVLKYLSNPRFAENLGAVETLDEESGLGVQSWSTFLDGAKRLARSLRYEGYNGVMLSVAADGSGLYPSQLLQQSPRYDTGLLAASGQDPTKKDVLEMLLRIFDREGIRVFPTLQLAAPLPNLESLRQTNKPQLDGITCVDYDGVSLWQDNVTDAGLAPYYNPLNQRVQAEVVSVVRELTNRYAQHRSFAGVSLQLSGEGYGLMPGLASGLDDHTVYDFSRTLGISITRDGNDSPRQRSLKLLSEHREQWRRWRQEQLTSLYHQVAENVRSQRSDLRMLLATEDLFAGRTLQQRVRAAIEQPQQVREILPDHAIDLAGIASHPAIEVLTLKSPEASDSLQQQPILAQTGVNAALFFAKTDRFRLSSFDQQSPFGTDQTFLTVRSRQTSIGRDQNSAMMRTLGSRDCALVVQGGDVLQRMETETRSTLQTIRQLPNVSAEREQVVQPVTLRVYRTPSGSVIALINESPWATAAEVELAPSATCEWRKLGTWASADSAELRGKLQGSNQLWNVQLQPHQIQAWKFTDTRMRVGELRVKVDQLAHAELERRIQDIESRASNLSVQRSYPQLQNPSFESPDAQQSIAGWQPRQGAMGSVTLDRSASRSGEYSLRLKSENSMGVAVQSHLFPAPATGQLTVSANFRSEQVAQDAELLIAVQDGAGGREYQQFAVLSHQQLDASAWTRFELPLNDVPAGEDLQLQVQLHLTGKAELLIDDVELLDLRFDDSRRRSLVTRIHGAKIALEQGQLVDCLRVVDDYWSRYLLEHVPPTESNTYQATKPTTPVTPTPASQQSAEENGFGSRVRGWVPKLWR